MAGFLGLAIYNWEKLIFYLWIGLIKSTFDWGLPSFALNLGNPCCFQKKSWKAELYKFTKTKCGFNHLSLSPLPMQVSLNG